MSTVVLQVLRAGDPELAIDFLCEDAYAEALAGHPLVGRLHRLAADRRGSDARARTHERVGGGGAAGTWGTIRRLREARYDLAVDLFFNPRSAWLLWMAGIPLRIGGTTRSRRRLYTHTVVREDPRCAGAAFAAVAPGGLGDHLCRLAPLRHVPTGLDFVPWLLDAFAPGGILPVLPPRAPDPAARRALAAAGCDSDRPYLVAAPGATWPTKEWPREHWRALLDGLGAEGAPPVAVLVPPGREAEFGALAGGFRPGGGGILPALPLRAALALVGDAAGLVTVDGGIMHAAVALGVPTVALFGPTPPGIWFPYGSRPTRRVLATRPECRPCDRHDCDAFVCLPAVEPREVRAALAAVQEASR